MQKEKKGAKRGASEIEKGVLQVWWRRKEGGDCLLKKRTGSWLKWQQHLEQLKLTLRLEESKHASFLKFRIWEMIFLYSAFLVHCLLEALYNTHHIFPFVHILTLMAQATMLGANLLIRSSTALPNQRAPRYFYALTSMCTAMEQPSGATGIQYIVQGSWWSQQANHNFLMSGLPVYAAKAYTRRFAH